MSRVESRIAEHELLLPAPMHVPGGVKIKFPWVNIRGDRAYCSGHIPLTADGLPAGPFGQVGAEVSKDEAHLLARNAGLSMLASLKRALGDLDRVTAWCRVFGMVNSAPGFDQHPFVINGFTDLILEIYGEDAGAHSRSAIGVAGLPMNVAVEVEAEVIFR
ncbi:MAG: RidA family protein [Pseudomonadota bacterium]